MIDLENYIAEHLEDEKFFFDLQDKLDELEPSQEAVDSLLDAICSYDALRELYDTILSEDFKEYLSESTVFELEKKYKIMFD